MPRFAKGGAVKTADIRNIESTTITKGGNRSVHLDINTLDVASFADFLRNGAVDEIRKAFFEEDLNFAGNSGVF